MKKKYNKTETNVFKATVILVMKDGTVISGPGTFSGIRDADDMSRFTITLIKPMPKK